MPGIWILVLAILENRISFYKCLGPLDLSAKLEMCLHLEYKTVSSGEKMATTSNV